MPVEGAALDWYHRFRSHEVQQERDVRRMAPREV